MKKIRSILILSVVLFSFSNCDLLLGLLQRDDDTVESLSYELTSSSIAMDADEERLQLNDQKVKGKFLCQKACFEFIPAAFDICFTEFKECKKNGGGKECGKAFRVCAKEANVTIEDWKEFKICKQTCRETAVVCREPFRQCKSECEFGDMACIGDCKEEMNVCFQENVCPTYPVFCNHDPRSLED